MAPPHVSGAAAILAQEHPDWSGQRIKAALMSSTVPLNGSYSPYEQGTGRADLARALRQTVIADTPCCQSSTSTTRIRVLKGG